MSLRFKEFSTNPEIALNEINQFLNQKQKEYYSTVPGLAHPILSKNMYISRFLELFLSGKASKVRRLFLLKQSLKYFIKFLIGFFYESSLILLSSKEKEISNNIKFGIITFFNASKYDQSIYDDIYFKGLQDKLNNNKTPYVYLPIFYLLSRNPFTAISQIERAKKLNPNIISPYSILTFRDVIWMFYYGIKFYFSNLNSINLNEDNYLQKCFNEAMADKLSNSEVNKFLYYFVAKRLASRLSEFKFLIWYENIAVDKCIIKGLRENKGITILGGQFFLLLNQELNLYPSPFECELNLVPDKIFINQKLPSMATAVERYSLGVGLRYQYIHKYNLDENLLKNENKIAVCLCLYVDKSEYMVKILNESAITGKEILIKKHPGNPLTHIPKKANFTEYNGSQEELLLKSTIVIGADSGIVFEAMALGRQVIILASENLVSYYIPPKEYLGKLWDIAYNSIELEMKIEELLKYKLENQMELLNLSLKIREELFLANNQDILEILELK